MNAQTRAPLDVGVLHTLAPEVGTLLRAETDHAVAVGSFGPPFPELDINTS